MTWLSRENRRKTIQHISNSHLTYSGNTSMKLNPKNYTAGKFLGYMVTKRGIEDNPNQIKVIIKMRSPRTMKEIQSLTRWAAALSRFLSRSTDKCKSFFMTIKKNKGSTLDRWMRRSLHKAQRIHLQTFVVIQTLFAIQTSWWRRHVLVLSCIWLCSEHSSDPRILGEQKHVYYISKAFLKL